MNTMRIIAGVATLSTLACSSADPSQLPAEEVVNQGCENDDDCTGGRCIQGLPGGLCTAECTSQEDCPEGTVCTDTEAVDGVCLFTCDSAQFCRDQVGEGYTCDTETNLTTEEDVRVCIDA